MNRKSWSARTVCPRGDRVLESPARSTNSFRSTGKGASPIVKRSPQSKFNNYTVKPWQKVPAFHRAQPSLMGGLIRTIHAKSVSGLRSNRSSKSKETDRKPMLPPRPI